MTATAMATATADEPRMNAETRGSLLGREGSWRRSRKLWGCEGAASRAGAGQRGAGPGTPRTPRRAARPLPPKKPTTFPASVRRASPGRDRSASGAREAGACVHPRLNRRCRYPRSSASIRGSFAVAVAVSAALRVHPRFTQPLPLICGHPRYPWQCISGSHQLPGPPSQLICILGRTHSIHHSAAGFSGPRQLRARPALHSCVAWPRAKCRPWRRSAAASCRG